MLCNATVSGMPHLSRFASCVVKVASSCKFGLRWRRLRNIAGMLLVPAPPPMRPPRAALAVFFSAFSTADTPAFEASTMTGNKPSRSIWLSAAARSATSRTPCTTSPVRRRAL